MRWNEGFVTLSVLCAASGAQIALAQTTADVSLVVDRPQGLVSLPLQVIGRHIALPAKEGGGLRRQWPATTIEASFVGEEAFLEVGEGEVSLSISINGAPRVLLSRPVPGLYRVGPLSSGTHHIRVSVVSESQGGETKIGGLFVAKPAKPLRAQGRAVQIEVIGDSHSVGYANMSHTRDCDTPTVWSTTDSSAGIAGQLAYRYGADVELNAISGRGIVRNYAGGKDPTIPVAYDFALLNGPDRWSAKDWSPAVVTIALGTNDFSTPLTAQEPWPNREALRADYVARYEQFLAMLRGRYPKARILVWMAGSTDGEASRASAEVAARRIAAGDRNLAFVPVPNLGMTACHYHPDAADAATITAALAREIDGNGSLSGSAIKALGAGTSLSPSR